MVVHQYNKKACPARWRAKTRSPRVSYHMDSDTEVDSPQVISNEGCLTPSDPQPGPSGLQRPVPNLVNFSCLTRVKASSLRDISYARDRCELCGILFDDHPYQHTTIEWDEYVLMQDASFDAPGNCLVCKKNSYEPPYHPEGHTFNELVKSIPADLVMVANSYSEGMNMFKTEINTDIKDQGENSKVPVALKQLMSESPLAKPLPSSPVSPTKPEPQPGVPSWSQEELDDF